MFIGIDIFQFVDELLYTSLLCNAKQKKQIGFSKIANSCTLSVNWAYGYHKLWDFFMWCVIIHITYSAHINTRKKVFGIFSLQCYLINFERYYLKVGVTSLPLSLEKNVIKWKQQLVFTAFSMDVEA